MNYLAHILLSSKSIDYQLGNLLADPLKGKIWQSASVESACGIKMHASIDRFTDVHPLVKMSKSTLATKGHLRGVVLDIVYDYLLLKHWNLFVTIDSNVFIENFHYQSILQSKNLPENAQKFIESIVYHDVLSSYNEFSNLKLVLKQVDKRLSPRVLAKESTYSYFPSLVTHFNKIEINFLNFFPDLVSHFKQKSHLSDGDYWLK